MVFEDFFGGMMGDRRGNGRVRESEMVRVPLKDYESLKAKAKKYKALAEEHKALVEEHKKVKTWNDQMLKELDDMKQDARRFKELEEEKEKFLKQLLQVRADFDNYRKRQERENSKYKARVTQSILRRLTEHYDDLERASNQLKMLEGAEGISKGFEIIVNNFKKLLEAEGVRPMELEGERFDPYKHEALSVEEGRDDLPENTIVEVLDKGYYINDAVLKPAKVRISKPLKEVIEGASEVTPEEIPESKTETKSESKIENLTKKVVVN
ncbi:MAG: nucleotide exchange factor GrpE [Promethearchaeota archaeon]